MTETQILSQFKKCKHWRPETTQRPFLGDSHSILSVWQKTYIAKPVVWDSYTSVLTSWGNKIDNTLTGQRAVICYLQCLEIAAQITTHKPTKQIPVWHLYQEDIITPIKAEVRDEVIKSQQPEMPVTQFSHESSFTRTLDHDFTHRFPVCVNIIGAVIHFSGNIYKTIWQYYLCTE